MRLFIAINFDKATVERLLTVERELRARSRSDASWSPPRNLHLTLAFLGEVESKRLPELRQIVGRLNVFPRFELRFDRIGGFGERVLFAGLRRSDELAEIHVRLTSELQSSGFDVEEREFKPHVTLARRVGASLAREYKLEPFGFTADRVSLMRSQLGNGPAEYTELYGCDFAVN